MVEVNGYIWHDNISQHLKFGYEVILSGEDKMPMVVYGEWEDNLQPIMQQVHAETSGLLG